MQAQKISKKPLTFLVFLVLAGMLILAAAVYRYNKSFFVYEKKEIAEKIAEVPEEQFDIIPISRQDPIIGEKTAKNTLIAFEDFLCATCRRQEIFLSELLTSYPKQIKIIWKDFAITQIPNSSTRIHEYGFCMNQQNKFPEFQKVVFTTLTSPTELQLQNVATTQSADMSALEECLNSGLAIEHIEKNKILARALNIQQAPTFFLNGNQIKIPKSIEEWETVIGIE